MSRAARSTILTVGCRGDTWEVVVRDGAAEEALLSHFLHNIQVEVLVVVGISNARHQTFLGELLRSFVYCSLVISQ